MVDIPQTSEYRVIKQPTTGEEKADIYTITARNTRLASSINSGSSIMCEDLLRCLCWCCYLGAENPNSDCNCCSNGSCDCDCSGCDAGDCGGCDC